MQMPVHARGPPSLEQQQQGRRAKRPRTALGGRVPLRRTRQGTTATHAASNLRLQRRACPPQSPRATCAGSQHELTTKGARRRTPRQAAQTASTATAPQSRGQSLASPGVRPATSSNKQRQATRSKRLGGRVLCMARATLSSAPPKAAPTTHRGMGCGPPKAGCGTAKSAGCCGA